jgi:hypothetical protein
MINKNDLSNLLEEIYGLMLKQVDGLSHADSLIQPQPGGNCLNWVMGHLVDNLADILEFLGGKRPTDLPDLSHYGFGSEPVLGDGPGVQKLEVLIDTYTQLNAQVVNRLAEMDASDFDEEIDYFRGKGRRGYVVFFFFYHHSYHIGQLEQLRNLAGRTEKIV